MTGPPSPQGPILPPSPVTTEAWTPESDVCLCVSPETYAEGTGTRTRSRKDSPSTVVQEERDGLSSVTKGRTLVKRRPRPRGGGPTPRGTRTHVSAVVPCRRLSRSDRVWTTHPCSTLLRTEPLVVPGRRSHPVYTGTTSGRETQTTLLRAGPTPGRPGAPCPGHTSPFPWSLQTTGEGGRVGSR